MDRLIRGVDEAVVVLSGSIGAGHDTVAEVCSQALASTSVTSATLDCMALLGGLPQRIGDLLFRSMLATPPLFDAFHFSSLRAGSRLARWMESGAAGRLVPALDELLDHRRGGLLLSVFATGSGAAGRIRQRHPQWRAAAFCTDAAAHQMWVHDGVERYFVCSSSAAGTVRQYLPSADVVELPPPVRAPFFTAPSRPAARDRLGLDPNAPHVLLTGGALGRGPLGNSAVALADAGYHVLVVAGRNHRLAAHADALVEQRHGKAAGAVRVYGYVEDMATVMAAADVIVTSPGQTCHEARVVGRPMVLLDTVPGHGRENLLVELGDGGAIAALPAPQRVVQAVDAVMCGNISPPIGWPIRDPADWHARFTAAIDDLLPARGSQPQSATGTASQAEAS